MSISRRNMLAAGGALAAAAVVGTDGQAATPRARKARTFMLVHGGGHGGWCWERVATPLRAAGHLVYTPTLTGLADRQHLLNSGINLDTHITDVVNLMKWDDLTDVILVGHSYGGMVITGIADRALERIGHNVYLDAAHPRNGSGMWGGPSAAAGGGGGAAAAGGAPAGGGGGAAGGGGRMTEVVNGVELTIFPNEAFVKGPLGVTDPKDVAWMMQKLTPHPMRCFTQPLVLQREAEVHKLPTTDIWRAPVIANLRKTNAQYTWAQNVWEIDSNSHNLMITEPKKTTDMLLKIAAM